nr:hypothetical protein [Tanacetum cinerariifolium]
EAPLEAKESPLLGSRVPLVGEESKVFEPMCTGTDSSHSSASSDSTTSLSPDHPLTRISPYPTPTHALFHCKTACKTTPSPSPTLPVQKRYRATYELLLDTDSEREELGDKDADEGREDESSDVDDKREGSDDEGHGLDDEGLGLDDEDRGLDDEGRSLNEGDEATPEGQQGGGPGTQYIRGRSEFWVYAGAVGSRGKSLGWDSNLRPLLAKHLLPKPLRNLGGQLS